MDVKKRYRDMTKVYHPDIWKNKNAHPVYQLILEAYGVLENKQARGRYDSFLDKKHNSGNKTKDFKSDYQNFETRRQKRTGSKDGQKPYDYWNRQHGSQYHDFSQRGHHQAHEQAKQDAEFYRKAYRAGKRTHSQQSEDYRKASIGYGWILMGGLAFYLVGWDTIKRMIFGDDGKSTAAEEAAKRRKLEKRTILKKEHLQDTPGTINNRINEMEKELNKRKIVISIEKDTISLDAKQREKAKTPKFVKKINKKMQAFNPKLKLYKAKDKVRHKKVSLREHYENWNGKVGGDQNVKYDEMDWNELSPEEQKSFLDLENLANMPGLEGVELEENYM